MYLWGYIYGVEGSYDGSVKIIDPLLSSDALLDVNLCAKGVTRIEWDSGGKFL